MPTITITDELQAERIRGRIRDLMGCEEGSPEEEELIELLRAIEEWESKNLRAPLAF